MIFDLLGNVRFYDFPEVLTFTNHKSDIINQI